MTTLSDALVAYRICAQAEGRSPRTIEWITSSVRYFSEFLGGDPELSNITAWRARNGCAMNRPSSHIWYG